MSIIIGIDHGYYAIKTAHCSFPAGLTSYGEHEPYTRQGLLEFGGCFFVCGSGRQPIQRDKTVNDNYYLLTLAAIAKEIQQRGLPSECSVRIAAGLPLTSFGRDKPKFRDYLLRSNQPVNFKFEGVEYSITIEEVAVFPQGYAALMTEPGLLQDEPSMIYTQLIQTLYRQADRVHKGRLPVPVHCLMDEYANISLPKDTFLSALATMRSRAIFCSIIVQNMAQLKAMYKDDWESLVGLCDEFLYLGGTEKETHKYVSELLGKETISTTSYNQSKGRSGSYSINHQQSGRDLMTPDEVRLLDNSKCIQLLQLFSEGGALGRSEVLAAEIVLNPGNHLFQLYLLFFCDIVGCHPFKAGHQLGNILPNRHDIVPQLFQLGLLAFQILDFFLFRCCFQLLCNRFQGSANI